MASRLRVIAPGQGLCSAYTLGPPTTELPSNPQWQGKVGFDYSMPMGNGLAFFYGLDVFHSDSYFSESRNLVEIDDYTRLNGFLGLGADDRQWQATLAVKNITDEEVITGAYLTDDSSGLFTNIFLTEPRTYGISLTKEW